MWIRVAVAALWLMSLAGVAFVAAPRKSDGSIKYVVYKIPDGMIKPPKRR